MKNKLKNVVDNLQIALLLKARAVGGNQVTLDQTPIDKILPYGIEKDNFDFSKTNNLMEADWGQGPEVESSRFGDQKSWDEARKYGAQDLPEIEEEYKDMYTDDVSLLEKHPDYAKPEQVPINTAFIESIPYEEVKSTETGKEEVNTSKETR